MTFLQLVYICSGQQQSGKVGCCPGMLRHTFLMVSYDCSRSFSDLRTKPSSAEFYRHNCCPGRCLQLSHRCRQFFGGRCNYALCPMYFYWYYDYSYDLKSSLSAKLSLRWLCIWELVRSTFHLPSFHSCKDKEAGCFIFWKTLHQL